MADKRYNLLVAEALWDKIVAYSEQDHSDYLTIILTAIKLYMRLRKAKEDGAVLILRKDGKEIELEILF